MTAALLIGAFRLLDQHPLLSGGLLGVLICKPRFWLMLPVALIAAKQWRALFSVLTAALPLMLASAAGLGIQA